ncbi:TPA: HNH endonuclease [Clostridium perfringens]
MSKKKKCVYCGKDILKKSKEHIIQNAIGGLYESEDICCPDCNNYVSKYIDVPFTKIFNPIIGRIENFVKTNNKKSKPSYTGRAIYDNKIYDVLIKNGKVISCKELSKKLKCDVSKLDFEIICYNFDIDNSSFKNGIAKIAFNFAIEKGIRIDVFKKGVNVEEKDGKIENISFKYPIIPFIALNPMDRYIELDTKIELYHNLILFNQSNMLWCYVDLFNTFQHYVLLSDEWDENISIYETYLQLIQKIDRTVPEIYVRRPKDILAYATQFNIEPCMDLEVLKKRVEERIQKESLKRNMNDVISYKLIYKDLDINKINQMKIDEFNLYRMSLLLYFDEDDRLREKVFRKFTYYGRNIEKWSYPMLINNLIRSNEINVNSYTFEKFKRLSYFLEGIDNAKNNHDDE